MKCVSNKMEYYINNIKRENLHPYLNNVYKSFYIKSNEECENINSPNLIFYGPSNIGKYTQSLFYIHHFSPSKLKYERKIIVNTNSKISQSLKVSDIHIEIDMELLGCNARVTFNDIYSQAIDIFSAKKNKSGFILCKNFHKIHNELLDVFYSYMQNLDHIGVKIKFIIITDHIAFIPENITKKCQIVCMKKPNKTTYEKCMKENIKSKGDKNTHISGIQDEFMLKYSNMKSKNIKYNDADIDNNDNNKYLNDMCNKHLLQKEEIVAEILYKKIINYEEMNYAENRDILYDILIYDINIDLIIIIVFEK